VSRLEGPTIALSKERVLKVNADFRVHIGSWERVLACGIPPFLYGILSPVAHTLVFRIPGLADYEREGEFRIDVHHSNARVCIYLPRHGDGARKSVVEGLSLKVGSFLWVSYRPTFLVLRKLR